MGYQFNVLTGKFDRAGEGTEGPAGTVSAAGDGTATAPSISFSSDTNSGLYKSGSDSISITTGGVTGVTVDSSQNSTFAGHINVKGGGTYAKLSTSSQGVNLEGNGTDHYILDLHNTGSGKGSQITFRNDHDASGSIGLTGDTTGDLRIYTEKTFKVAHGADLAITSTTNGAVSLYYDGGTAKLSTTATGVNITSNGSSHGLNIMKGSTVAAFLGHIGTGDEGFLALKNGGVNTIELNGETGDATFGGDISLANSKNLLLGTDGSNAIPLQIYHNGAHSSIQNFKGNLHLAGQNVRVTNANFGETFISCDVSSAVKLYGWGSSSALFETTASGAKVTGSLEIIEPLSTNSAHIKMGTNTNQNTHLELENDGSADIRFGCFGSSATAFGNITANNGFIHTTNDLSINAASDTGSVKIGVGATPSTKLTIASDGNTTFAGNVGIGATPVPTASNYNGATLHLHQTDSSSAGSQVHLTNGATGGAAGDGSHISMWSDNNLYISNKESTGELRFSTGGISDVLILSNSGNATFAGNIKMAATKGIQFSPYDETVSTPGSDSNTLSDYEEGTWEPTIVSGSTVTSYNAGRVGRYTKTGRMVTCSFNIGWSGTANGLQLKIGNLPFTDADSGALGGGQVLWTSLPTLTTSDGMSLLVSNGTTVIECYDGVNPAVSIANTTSISNKVLYGIITYEAA